MGNLWDGVFSPTSYQTGIKWVAPIEPIPEDKLPEVIDALFDDEKYRYKTWYGEPGGTVVGKFERNAKNYVLVQFKKTPERFYVYQEA